MLRLTQGKARESGLPCAEQDGYHAFDDHRVRSPLLQPREVGTIVTLI